MINRVAVCIIIVLYIHDTERGLLMEKLKTFDVDLKRLFFEVLKRLWLILLVGIVCGSGVFLYAKFFITPQYKATATIYIQNYTGENDEKIYSSDLSASQTWLLHIRDCSRATTFSTESRKSSVKITASMLYAHRLPPRLLRTHPYLKYPSTTTTPKRRLR